MTVLHDCGELLRHKLPPPVCANCGRDVYETERGVWHLDRSKFCGNGKRAEVKR